MSYQKKYLFAFLVALLFIFVLFTSMNIFHLFEAIKKRNQIDYQLKIHNNKVQLYDNNSYLINSGSLDSLVIYIENDNL